MSLPMLALHPSPEGRSNKRRWPGESSPGEQELLAVGVVPKRRFAEARRHLNVDAWVAHLRTRYPGMSDKARSGFTDACCFSSLG